MKTTYIAEFLYNGWTNNVWFERADGDSADRDSDMAQWELALAAVAEAVEAGGAPASGSDFLERAVAHMEDRGFLIINS
ncbi:hypothetical protein FACS189499_07220 [Clostridia bacterium]|nr:hypothetical protein FACS189499_07220 [Clostridia bacterium]